MHRSPSNRSQGPNGGIGNPSTHTQRPSLPSLTVSSFVGTSEQYAAKVSSYSERSKESYLHPGTHYRQLAQYLRASSSTTDLSSRSSISSSPASFGHIVIHNWEKGSRNKEVYDTDRGLQRLSQLPAPEPDSGRIIFLRGHSSRDWLLQVGAQHRIDPEYFRRHMEFLQKSDFYDLPALPSCSRNILQLRIVTICTRQLPLTRRQIDDARGEETNSVKRHQRRLGEHSAIGESIIRRYSVHDESIFTIEQDITFCVKKKNRGWVAMVWLDNGKDLSEGPWGPWIPTRRPTNAFQSLCHPIIQHRPKAALLSNSSSIEAGVPGQVNDAAPLHNEYVQNATLLASQYGTTIDQTAAAMDPLYALSELFAFATSSESQFLNLMLSQIQKDLTYLPDKMEIQVANLEHRKALLDEHVERLRYTVELLRSHSLFEWRKDPMDTRERPAMVTETIDKAVQTSLLDYEHLLDRALRLSQQCLGGTEMIMNRAMLKEARKSIDLAETVIKLSYMAFFFLPLSFTASFFGMNFKQFGTGTLNIWVMFVSLAPIMGISFVVCFWSNMWSFRGGLRQKEVKV